MTQRIISQLISQVLHLFLPLLLTMQAVSMYDHVGVLNAVIKNRSATIYPNEISNRDAFIKAVARGANAICGYSIKGCRDIIWNNQDMLFGCEQWRLGLATPAPRSSSPLAPPPQEYLVVIVGENLFVLPVIEVRGGNYLGELLLAQGRRGPFFRLFYA